uniref:Uncharacterized protein n=1 Tax=Arundo donax TaxID=35708 RepID=A0A0A8YBC6_ARUDO
MFMRTAAKKCVVVLQAVAEGEPKSRGTKWSS